MEEHGLCKVTIASGLKLALLSLFCEWSLTVNGHSRERMVTHVREWSLTVAEVTDLPRTHFNPHSRALAGWLYLIQSWDGVQDPSFSLPGIWQAARRGRQCSLASRRQVWCLLSAANRLFGITGWVSFRVRGQSSPLHRPEPRVTQILKPIAVRPALGFRV